MDQNNPNPGGTGRAGGSANTPPFGSEPRAGESAAGHRSPSARDGMSAGGRSETERELERTRDMVAERAAPVVAEKVQETISETTSQLRSDPEMQQQIKRTASAVQHDAQEMISERVDQVRGRAEERVNQGIRQVADHLDAAADRIDGLADQRLGSDRGGSRARAGQMAHTVADTMESMAGYLRDNDVQGLRSDLERQVRERPLETLLMGVAAGWIVGKILR